MFGSKRKERKRAERAKDAAHRHALNDLEYLRRCRDWRVTVYLDEGVFDRFGSSTETVVYCGRDKRFFWVHTVPLDATSKRDRVTETAYPIDAIVKYVESNAYQVAIFRGWI